MAIESVLISGAGIGGPALAWWLARAGKRVTVVERAPSLRCGGQAVDFRGAAHMEVLERMGLVDAIRARATHMGAQSFIDATGARVAELPSSFMSGEIEIARGDLCRILYEATKDRVEYVFGDSIAAMEDRGSHVEVRFERSAPSAFDLVVGADGLHSKVRALAFGDEARFLRFHDHYVAGFSLPNILGLDREGVIYSDAGGGVSYACGAPQDRARALFVFRSPPRAELRGDGAAQRALVAATFARSGWQVPRLLEALDVADDLYFDSIASVVMERFTKGRVALLGDAGYGGTLGGQGTGLAMVAAYVLAGELARREDLAEALRSYEACIGPYARGCRSGLDHVGPFFAPMTPARRWIRDHVYGLLASRPFERVLGALTTRAARGIELESYAM